VSGAPFASRFVANPWRGSYGECGDSMPASFRPTSSSEITLDVDHALVEIEVALLQRVPLAGSQAAERVSRGRPRSGEVVFGHARSLIDPAGRTALLLVPRHDLVAAIA